MFDFQFIFLNKMTIDAIIAGLNDKENITDIAAGKYNTTELTKSEIDFLSIYCPDKYIVVYGTLAPNAPNHKVIAHIKGTWTAATVCGKLEKEGWGADLGYYGFRHSKDAEKQEEIKAFVLFSDNLAENWAYLDDFEGEGYKRILAKYTLPNGDIGVGNIYAIR